LQFSVMKYSEPDSTQEGTSWLSRLRAGNWDITGVGFRLLRDKQRYLLSMNVSWQHF